MTTLTSERPIYVFDGHCVLCSNGVRLLMHLDPERRLGFLSAQSDLGRKIYSALAVDLDESYLFIDRAGVHLKSDGWIRAAKAVGGWMSPLMVLGIVPRRWRDWSYDVLARKRYHWFGRADHCALLSPDQRTRLIGEDKLLAAQLDSLLNR